MSLPKNSDFDNQPETTRTYWGSQAAGCIFISKDTGRILLAHRSNEVDFEPETWGTWGGKIDAGETPTHAVQREVEEETGFDGNYKIHPLYVYKDNGFSYHNYMVLVPFEFTPQLNWENQGSKWVEYGHWPEPLHFGMEALLQHSGTTIKRVIDLIKKRKNKLTEIDSPPPIVQSTNVFDNNFIKYMKSIENAAMIGFSNGMWYPHVSPEGGFPTIGYGHKLKNNADVDRANKGLTDSEVEKLLHNDLKIALKKAYKDIDEMFGVKIPLSKVQEEILTDYTFNLGTIKGFPKFVKAVLNNDWKTAEKEYKRTAKINGNRVELSRNKHFAARYFKSMNENIENIEIQPQGLIDISTHGYKWITPYGYLAFGYDKTFNIFHLLMIQTKKEYQDKGYSKELLRSFFEYMKKHNGKLNPGSYTMSGMAWTKHVLERFSKEFGVPLINIRHPHDI